ncbi:MAG: hypothetical protein ACM3JD_05440 [Rudaea sp.]
MNGEMEAMATATLTRERARPAARVSSAALFRALLAAIVLIEVASGTLYAFKTPAWQAPDEPAHFNYVRHIAETGTLPVLKSGDYNQAYLEKIKAARFPPDMPIDSIRYEMYQPPLYYLAAAPVYIAAQAVGANPLLALRLLSVGLGALILLLAYRVLLHAFSQNRFLALAAVGLMATVPMNVALWAAAGADPLAELLLAVLLLVSMRRVQGELSDKRFVLFGGLLYGLALLTSTKIYPAFVLLLLAEIGQPSTVRSFGLRFSSAGTLRRIIRVLAPLLLVALAVSGWWFLRNMMVYGGTDILGWARHDSVVVGQLTTGEALRQDGWKHVLSGLFVTTFKSFWAQFGWMGVLVNDRIYVGLFLLTAAALFGLLLWVVRLVRSHAQDVRRVEWNWLLLSLWLVVMLLSYAWYNLRFIQPQGRYLFPALIPIAAFFVVGLYELIDKRYAGVTFALIYLGLVGLDLASLFLFIIPQLAL